MAAASASSENANIEVGGKRKLESEADDGSKFLLPDKWACLNPHPEWNEHVDVSKPAPIGSYFRLPDGSVRLGGIPPIFTPPGRSVDASSGFETYVPKKDISSTDDILKCIDAVKFPPRENNIRFITFRNNLNKIMVTPYSAQDWTIGVRFDPVADLVMLDVEKQVEVTDPLNSYCGRRWEQFCTRSVNELLVDSSQVLSPAPGATSASASAAAFLFSSAPEAKEPKDEYQQEFCVVERLRLGSHRILMAAEIDCFEVPNDVLAKLPRVSADERSNSELPPLPFSPTPEALAALRAIPLATLMDQSIEVKSSIDLRFGRYPPQFMGKLLRYWIQSYLAGVPRIFLGWRQRNLIKDSEMLHTQKLPSIANTFFDNLKKDEKKLRPKAQDFSRRWHPNVALNFTERLLSFVWKRVHDDATASSSPPPKSAALSSATDRFHHYRLRFHAPYSFVYMEKLARRALRA